MSLFEYFFKVLSLYLEARIQIRIRIKVKRRIRIHIKVTSRIRMRIRFKLMQIRNTIACKPHYKGVFPGCTGITSFYANEETSYCRIWKKGG